jgi:hypothetical protein
VLSQLELREEVEEDQGTLHASDC